MQYIYNPSSNKEKFAMNIIDALVDNFAKTFFVGGMVRDMLLQKNITDIDIATEATPVAVKHILQKNGIAHDATYEQFGVIVAHDNDTVIEITTLRAEQYTGSRFPKVEYISDVAQDSNRRDFTINSFYLQPKTAELLDFHNGITDIGNRTIRFIGDPLERIQEDPLRIVRAYRFQFTLQFNFTDDTEYILQSNMPLLKTISQKRIEHELQKVTDVVRKKMLQVMHKNT